MQKINEVENFIASPQKILKMSGDVYNILETKFIKKIT